MRRLAAVLLLLLAAPLVAAAEDDVDLELVLLADATGSIDMGELLLQRRGYAEAMVDPRVLAAIAEGAHGRIAVTYVEWAGPQAQDVVVDWMLVGTPAEAADFSNRLMTAPRRAYGRNAIGAALLKGVDLIQSNAHEGFRKVIDFSGDSANNWIGPGIEEGRRAALAAGIVINGLAILCRTCESGRSVNYDLEKAFFETIIAGPGSFVVTADGDEAFADAVRRKLIMEIAGDVPPVRLAAEQAVPAP
jgi:hypothetical protein